VSLTTTIEYPHKTIRTLLQNWLTLDGTDDENLWVMKADLDLALTRLAPSLRHVVELVQAHGDEALESTSVPTEDGSLLVTPPLVKPQEYAVAVEVLYIVLNIQGVGGTTRVHHRHQRLDHQWQEHHHRYAVRV
jgi:hypothetical protein